MRSTIQRRTIAVLTTLGMLAALLALAISPAEAVPEGPVQLISVNADGDDAGNDRSQSLPSVSDDGRYIAFGSDASDLVAGMTDANGGNFGDVYLRDTVMGTTTLVSHAAGTPLTTGDRSSGNPRISADGAYVVYDSFATNLTAGQSDANNERDVFLYSVETGTNTLVSHAFNDVDQACDSGASLGARISDDGAYVAYQSPCTNLQDNLAGTGGQTNVWRYDRAANASEVVSRRFAVNPNSIETGNGASLSPDISGQGNVVVYTTSASNIAPTDTNGATDVGYWRAPVGTLDTLSTVISTSGGDTGNGSSSRPSVSDDGVWVAFETEATDIGPVTDNNNAVDVILAEVTVGQGTNYTTVSANTAGSNTGNGASFKAEVAGGGGHVAFLSQATDVVTSNPMKSDGTIWDVLRYDRGSDSVTLVSRNTANTAGGDGDSGQPGIVPGLTVSDDGQTVVYGSEATNLSDLDDSANPDIYATDLTGAPAVSLLSVNADGDGEGAGDSLNPALSSNGDYAAFRSDAPDLTETADSNNDDDVFAVLGEIAPTISIDDVEALEGDAGETTFTFTVSLAVPVPGPGPVTVDYATMDASATGGDAPGEGVDYLHTDGTLTFTTGESAETVQVTVYGDEAPEVDEDFTVELSNPTGGYTILDGSGTGTILDDDLNGPVVGIGNMSGLEGNEGTSVLEFKVKLGEASAGEVTVDYATADGSATGGEAAGQGVDYANASGTVTFAPGEEQQIVEVTVYGDIEIEGDETFTVDLSNPTGGYTIAEGLDSGTGTIVDDELVEVADLRDGVNDTLRVIVEGGPANNGNADVALRFSQATFPSPDGPAAEEDPAPDPSFAQNGSREALLATDGGFADALASGGLQGNTVIDGRPLLLTATDELYDSVLAELNRLQVQTVRILGGVAAISQAVEDELVAEGFTVSRIQGPTRLETAQDAAGQLFPDATTAILVRAFPAPDGDATQAFADSLAAGAWAADEGWPLLFTQTEVLSSSTAEYISQSTIQRIFVVGGEAAINESVLQTLRDQGIEVIRVSGPTRFDTALAIAQQRGYGNEADAEQVMVLDGVGPNAWAAGFSGAAYAAIHGAPVVLGAPDQIVPQTAAFLNPPPAFAVDENNVTGYVLVCGIAPERCTESRSLLGLPDLATITEPSGTYEQGGTATFELTGTFSAAGYETLVDCQGVQELVTGMAISNEGEATTTVDVTIPEDHPTGDCLVKIKLIYGNGSEQLAVADITVVEPGSMMEEMGM